MAGVAAAVTGAATGTAADAAAGLRPVSVGEAAEGDAAAAGVCSFCTRARFDGLAGVGAAVGFDELAAGRCAVAPETVVAGAADPAATCALSLSISLCAVTNMIDRFLSSTPFCLMAVCNLDSRCSSLDCSSEICS